MVLIEKIMQSATKPMSGPCTPMSLLANDAQPRGAGTGAAARVAALSLVWGFAISNEISLSALTFCQKLMGDSCEASTIHSVVTKNLLLAARYGVVVRKSDDLEPDLDSFLEEQAGASLP